MTIARLLVILLMVGTLLIGDRTDFGLPPHPNMTSPTSAPADAPPDASSDAASDLSSGLILVRPSGLSRMVPIGVFCQLFQVGVPSLLQPLRRKRLFPAIFAVALTCTLTMYTALGLSAVSVLADDVDPSCNLNWSPYKSPTIALIVSLFPAIDCLSVFPMNAIFLANNVRSGAPLASDP